jgi:hypothetical protein
MVYSEGGAGMRALVVIGALITEAVAGFSFHSQVVECQYFVCAAPGVNVERGNLKDARPAAYPDAWDALPIGDGRNLGPYMSAFQYTLTRSPAMDGLRQNCVYDGVYRPAGAPPAVLVLDIATTASGFEIVKATVRDAGALDEWQRECVARWLTGAELEASGVEAGRRHRVTYPVKLGEPEPR